MALTRRAPRRDDNERPIIDALESAGAAVCQLSVEDWPDLLVVFQGQKFLLEVKNPDGGRVREGQDSLHKQLEGAIAVVWNVEEALAAVGLADAPTPTIASVIINFPMLHVKLSNGASYKRHLLKLPELVHASEQERKKRFVYPDRVEWIMLDYSLTVEEVRKW